MGSLDTSNKQKIENVLQVTSAYSVLFQNRFLNENQLSETCFRTETRFWGQRLVLGDIALVYFHCGNICSESQ